MAMGSSRLLLLISPLLIQCYLTIAQPHPLYSVCSEGGNFTSNSTYKTNLDHLLTSLASDSDINYGFYNSSFGENNDQANAIALCRGDTKLVACTACVKNAHQVLRQRCPNQKEAIIWYDDCMLRYSDRNIFGNSESRPYFWMYNLNNISKVDQFSQALNALLTNLTRIASSGDSRLKFAFGNSTTTSKDTIYALVQCTPDLSKLQCSNCMNDTIQLIPKCCTGRQGGRVYTPSCQFRYEKDIFYDPAAVSSPQPSAAKSVPPPGPVGSTPTSPAPTSTSGISGRGSNIFVTFGTFFILIYGLRRLQT
uniref:Cysteine-rich repeat secretory protein 38-like isoform X1 n=1 Tax=Rhizophora mucronata TaxID=61149 RepID=A0A2P2QMX8_RHIMU